MANVATTRNGALVLIGLVLAIVTAACADDTTATDQNPSTTTPSTTANTTTTTTTIQTQTPQTTAPPSTTTAPVEPALIAWEDLENLSFELDGDTVGLEDGQATISYGGDSETMFLGKLYRSLRQSSV